MTSRMSFKNTSLIAVALLLVISVAAHAAPDKKDKAQGRLLFGKVLDQQDNPVVGAIVYLTNMRTHAVKTYIVGQEGTYRFPGLSRWTMKSTPSTTATRATPSPSASSMTGPRSTSILGSTSR